MTDRIPAASPDALRVTEQQICDFMVSCELEFGDKQVFNFTRRLNALLNPGYAAAHCRHCGRADNMHGPDGRSTDGSHQFESQGGASAGAQVTKLIDEQCMAAHLKTMHLSSPFQIGMVLARELNVALSRQSQPAPAGESAPLERYNVIGCAGGEHCVCQVGYGHKKYAQTPIPTMLASKSKEELVRIVEMMTEDIQWYVGERNRMITESTAAEQRGVEKGLERAAKYLESIGGDADNLLAEGVRALASPASPAGEEKT